MKEFNLQDMTFIQAFEEFQADASSINHKNGFTDELVDEFEQWFDSALSADEAEGFDSSSDRQKFTPLFAMFRNARVGLKLALVMSELGETLEAVRKDLGPDDHIPEFTAEEAEVADAIIRLMNYATDRKLRLAPALVIKNEFNRNRPDHSPKERASTHGKQF